MDQKPNMKDGKAKVSINLDATLLNKIDRNRELKGLRRSDWFVLAAQWYLKKFEEETANKNKAEDSPHT